MLLNSDWDFLSHAIFRLWICIVNLGVLMSSCFCGTKHLPLMSCGTLMWEHLCCVVKDAAVRERKF